jgi:hypothetical protein
LRSPSSWPLASRIPGVASQIQRGAAARGAIERDWNKVLKKIVEAQEGGEE